VTGPMLTQKQVCQLLQVTTKTLAKWRRSRKIRYARLGPHTFRFRQEDIADFVQRRQEGFRP
jgi:excisionase family DNA binding protein